MKRKAFLALLSAFGFAGLALGTGKEEPRSFRFEPEDVKYLWWRTPPPGVGDFTKAKFKKFQQAINETTPIN